MYLMFTLSWLDHDQKYNNLIVCVCHDDSEYTSDLFVFVHFTLFFFTEINYCILGYYHLYYIEMLQPLSTS